MKKLVQYPIIAFVSMYAIAFVLIMGAAIFVKQLFPVHQGEK